MLLLAKGMLVALTDHIDRNPQKNLLRGRIGYIDSWVVRDDEHSVYEDGVRVLQHMVTMVLVQYKEWVENDHGELEYVPCSWTIDGVGRPGIDQSFHRHAPGVWISDGHTRSWNKTHPSTAGTRFFNYST